MFIFWWRCTKNYLFAHAGLLIVNLYLKPHCITTFCWCTLAINKHKLQLETPARLKSHQMNHRRRVVHLRSCTSRSRTRPRFVCATSSTMRRPSNIGFPKGRMRESEIKVEFIAKVSSVPFHTLCGVVSSAQKSENIPASKKNIILI